MVPLLLALALVGSALATPPDAANCGVPKIAPLIGNGLGDRIVGGQEAKKYSWPWQVQIRYNGGHFCGASLISPDWILSAAHCFQGFSSSAFSFRLGRHTKSGTSEPYEQSASPKTIIMHESYSSFTLNNDVAVIRLSAAVKYTDQVAAVCLPTSAAELAENENVHITGWGNTEGTGSSTVLKQVMVPIISRTKCNQRDYYNGAITTGMICAGLDEGGRDSCQGDSGGPLVAKKGAAGQWEQFGVVSWGSGCADAKKPGVYSNVHFYRSWIKTKVTQVEEEERQVQAKFQPRPFGAAFREQAEELVRIGEIDESDLPLGGAWIHQA